MNKDDKETVQAMIDRSMRLHIRDYHKSPVQEPPKPPTPPPVDTSPIQWQGTVNLITGSHTLAGRNIKGQRGINGENDQQIDVLVVNSCRVESLDYGLYCGSCNDARLYSSMFLVGPGDNSYAVRGHFKKWTSEGNVFNNVKGSKALFRVYSLLSGYSKNDTFAGNPQSGRMMLGGGSGDERVNFETFSNFTFENGRFVVSGIDIYPNTHDVLFDHCDFSGSGVIGLWGGCYNIKFVSCVKDGRPLQQSDVYLGKDQDGTQFMNWNVPSSLRGVEIK